MKEKMLLILFSCLILLTVSNTLQAQAAGTDEIFVKCWKEGKERVADQVISVKLTQQQPEFEKEISVISGKKYRLRIVRNPDKSLKGEHWQVNFREITMDENQKEVLSENLLYRDKPDDTGGDFLPREQFASFFYPFEEKKVLVNGVPMIEWQAFYPVRTTRKFFVDGFYIIIRSGKVEFTDIDKSKIKLFELSVEFTNCCN